MERDRLRRLARARALDRLIDLNREEFDALHAEERAIVGLSSPATRVDRDLVVEEAERLIRTYGSTTAAGQAFDERYELRHGSGARLLRRVKNGSKRVTLETYDRLASLGW